MPIEILGYCPKCQEYITQWSDEWYCEMCPCGWHGPFKLNGKGGTIPRNIPLYSEPQKGMTSIEVTQALEAGKCVVCKDGTGEFDFIEAFDDPEEALKSANGDNHSIVIKKI